MILEQILQYSLYVIVFFLFIIIFKFGLKKQLSYIKVIIAGIIVGVLLDVILIEINQLFSWENYPFITGLVFSDTFICVMGFVILYAVSKSIYDWTKRKKEKK
jgi:lipopolysaccharide export LptBFGC system permease protein LptF